MVQSETFSPVFPGDGSSAGPALSEDLASFVARQGTRTPLWVDVLIVGSGYGGSMALHHLSRSTDAAGQRPRVLLLERGQQHLPGDFPERFADVPGHVRTSAPDARKAYQGRGLGLFDLRRGDDVQVLLGNGLGGGSLINAGVMLPPTQEVLAQPAWPDAIRKDSQALLAQMAEVSRLLQAHSAAPFARRHGVMQAMADHARAPAQAVPITVRPASDVHAPCRSCAGCFMGCNHGAKLSLDQTLLAQARQQGGETVNIVTGATVLRIRPWSQSGWEVDVVHTHEDARRTQAQPYRIRAGKLILAAGSLGSTEILLRSAMQVPMSGTVGQRFSANGDNVGFVHDHRVPTYGVGNPEVPATAQDSGPTITRCIDLRSTEGLVIEDLGVPAPMRQVFEELTQTVHALHRITRADRSVHDSQPGHDPARIHPEVTDRSLMVAIIGHDDADGVLRLRQNLPDSPTTSDGLLHVQWPSLRQDPRFDNRQRVFERLVGDDAVGAWPNPQYQPLPTALEQVYGAQRGALITVHPLGGCAMADNGQRGVVNHLGQVFTGSGAEVHDSLVVLDGAIVPCSLGINPALTIATLAHRAMPALLAQWGWPHTAASTTAPAVSTRTTRPTPLAPDRPRRKTLIEATELLWAPVVLTIDGEATPVVVELELWFMPVSVQSLTRSSLPAGEAVATGLKADPLRSEIRIFEPPAGPCGPERATGKLLMRASLEGELGWLSSEPTNGLSRQWHSLPAWFMNRGLSDIVKSLTQADGHHGHGHHGWLHMLRNALDLATHAGGIRHMHYSLRIGAVKGTAAMRTHERWGGQRWNGQMIEADKVLTYERACSPVNQLMQARLMAFPHWHRAPLQATPTLKLDPAYWAEVKVPLVRISELEDLPSAMLDMASFGLYALRALVPLHAWSLRLPDRDAPDRPHQRLPAAVPGLPQPQVFRLEIPGPAAAHAVLTRYRDPTRHDNMTRPPVLMLHGYSASGTTFAHPAIPHGGLGAYMAQRGHDVWVLDMRSSAGLPTATHPWQFADMGLHDIPLAVAHVLSTTGHKKLDVVAHCMGAAMLTLGLLSPGPMSPERAALPQRIRRLVFSQVGPAVQMSPLNTARAQVMQWLRQYLTLGAYELRPGKASGQDDMLDRLLALVPYSRQDFELENPWLPPWKLTPWAGTRHRMDLFYGVTFQLDQMPQPVLDRMDDFFGPLNLSTLTEVLNYADSRRVTDPHGAPLVSPQTLRLRMEHMEAFLSLHSINNQLASVQTASLMHGLFSQAGLPLQQVILHDMGHQDSLIGKRADITFEHIHHFLSREPS